MNIHTLETHLSAGLSLRKTAQRMGHSVETVRRYAHQLGLVPPGRRRLSPETIAAIHAALSAGDQSYSAIARALQINDDTVRFEAKVLGLTQGARRRKQG